MNLSDSSSYYLDLIKLYGRGKDCWKQTSFVSSAGDKDPNGHVIDTRKEAIENAVENVEVFPRHSATQGSRKEPSIAKSRSSKRRQIDEMELQNLITFLINQSETSSDKSMNDKYLIFYSNRIV